ncbi:hypothetical protein ACLD0U_14395 [Microbacterium sp. 2216-1]|uniref:hypothetical protein n=1 Tax=Microbacterium sp. 2216-1 TaxID=3390053 RepID=UPI0039756682
MTELDRFTLAEVSVNMFASPETFAAPYEDIIELLETKCGGSAWEVHSQGDATGDPEYRHVLERLREEAEVTNRRSG